MIRSPWPSRCVRLAARGALLGRPLHGGAGRRQDTGVVAGTVVDSTNQVVPGATATLTNENTVMFARLSQRARRIFVPRRDAGSYSVKGARRLPHDRAAEQRPQRQASSSTSAGCASGRDPSEVVTVQGQRHVPRDQETATTPAC